VQNRSEPLNNNMEDEKQVGGTFVEVQKITCPPSSRPQFAISSSLSIASEP
jgi:hypothetical protein